MYLVSGLLLAVLMLYFAYFIFKNHYNYDSSSSKISFYYRVMFSLLFFGHFEEFPEHISSVSSNEYLLLFTLLLVEIFVFYCSIQEFLAVVLCFQFYLSCFALNSIAGGLEYTNSSSLQIMVSTKKRATIVTVAEFMSAFPQTKIL